MKVWVVMSGEYSDRVIECIFSTKEKAEEWIKKIGKYIDDIDGTPEEYILDEYNADFCRYNVLVSISKTDGSADITRITDEDTGEVEEYNLWYEVVVHMQENSDVMIKAARDKLAMYKARELGI